MGAAPGAALVKNKLRIVGSPGALRPGECERRAGFETSYFLSRETLVPTPNGGMARWSGNTRNWSPIGAVTLNPERDCIIKTHSAGNHIQQLAA